MHTTQLQAKEPRTRSKLCLTTQHTWLLSFPDTKQHKHLLQCYDTLMVNNIKTIPAQKHGTSSNMNIVNVGGLMYTPAGNRYMTLYYHSIVY